MQGPTAPPHARRRGAALAARHADEIRDELRVKDVRFDAVDADLVVKPNLPVLGPRLGRELGTVRAALQAGEFEDIGGGRFRVAAHELGPDEVLVERAAKEGWAVAAEDGVTVALDTHVDEGLDRERRVYELIRRVNALRKDSGLALSDRIALTIPAGTRTCSSMPSGSRPRRSRSPWTPTARRARDRQDVTTRSAEVEAVRPPSSSRPVTARRPWPGASQRFAPRSASRSRSSSSTTGRWTRRRSSVRSRHSPTPGSCGWTGEARPRHGTRACRPHEVGSCS